MAGSYIGLGTISENRDSYSGAMDFYDKALCADEKSIVALTNKAHLLIKLGRYQEAQAIFNEAQSIDPHFRNLTGSKISVQLQLCDWSSLAKQVDGLQQKISNGLPATDPFIELTVSDSLRLQKKAAEIYCSDQYLVAKPLLAKQERASQKVKVAYCSADFRAHPVSFLTAELFEIHNREKFEFIGISFSNVKDEWHKRISCAFDQFIDASQMSDEEVINLAREIEIDIAIDLGGYTQKSRFGLFAKRLAPVQMSYLGYLGTTGSSCIDYIIADSEIIPTESQKFYSEKVAYLPSYQANDSHRAPSDLKFSKQSLGIPEDAFVYCCFNNNYKILPEVFASWMRILTKVEKSVLFLYVDNSMAQENLRKEAAARGVDPGRLIFGARLSVSDYLARYQVADLFLDTYPYNAGTTASDALWVGVPVLTRRGESFASRVASSLLTAVGIPELITKTTSEYEALAISLGSDADQLRAITLKLQANKSITPLFNTPKFAENLEKLYEIAHQRAISGQQPESIRVS
jgi:predicted O-linked N-acetylglucosamine transferase (SPINDLY family)